jgi:hypothetical protein
MNAFSAVCVVLLLSGLGCSSGTAEREPATGSGGPPGASAAGQTAAGRGGQDGDAGTEPAPDPDPRAAFECTTLWCDDFEGGELGTTPGLPWRVRGEGTAVFDATRAFSGNQSVKLSTSAGFDGRALMHLGAETELFPTEHFFGRLYLRVTQAPPSGVHWTMVQTSGGVQDDAAFDGQPFDAELRYGGQQSKRLMANYETPGAYSSPPTGPKTDCYQHSQTPMPEDRWACVEWEFDSVSQQMRFWLDDMSIEDLTVGTSGSGCVNDGLEGTWFYPTFEDLAVGWVDYQSNAGSRELWIDDVALGTERVGCPELD